MNAAIIVALIGAIVTVISAIYQRYVQSREQMEQAILEKKKGVYEEVMGALPKLVEESMSGGGVETAAALMTKVLNYGSAEVFNKFLALRSVLTSKEETLDAVCGQIGELVMAVRSDLGHKDPEPEAQTFKIIGAFYLGDAVKTRTKAESGEKA